MQPSFHLWSVPQPLHFLQTAARRGMRRRQLDGSGRGRSATTATLTPSGERTPSMAVGARCRPDLPPARRCCPLPALGCGLSRSSTDKLESCALWTRHAWCSR